MKLTYEQQKAIERFQETENLIHLIDEKIENANNLLEICESAEKELNKKQEAINQIIKEKSKGFPWLSRAISDYLNLQDEKIIRYLSLKKHPAPSAAREVNKIAIEKKTLIEQLQVAKYTIDLYEEVFPFISEIKEGDIEDLLLEVYDKYDKPIEEETEIEETEGKKKDPAQNYLSYGEFKNLTSTERNQKALDRYFQRKKTTWEIGRDYERYIGYTYEKQGYAVNYQGIFKGYEDLGRDLICIKDDEVIVAQCKYWAKNKTIHEKHINQLYGTTIKFFLDKYSSGKHSDLQILPDLIKKKKIIPCFVTSTILSNTALDFSEALGVKVIQKMPLKDYPIIKCHISKSTGEKIYHLPFDQQYDKTVLEDKYGEFYAMTVKEAEEAGFRRAWRWTGEG